MPLNVQKQVEYWRESSLDNLESAEILIKKKKLLEGLFFCHLSLEKILKAHVTKNTKGVPPKSHNLVHLLRLSKLDYDDSMVDFLGTMMEYQIEGRYPTSVKPKPGLAESKVFLSRTKETVAWFNNRL